jgi:hypothetical protein
VTNISLATVCFLQALIVELFITIRNIEQKFN